MKIKRIIIDICEACLDGIGEECHTPECALFLHSVDLPIDKELYEVIDEYELETIIETTEYQLTDEDRKGLSTGVEQIPNLYVKPKND